MRSATFVSLCLIGCSSSRAVGKSGVPAPPQVVDASASPPPTLAEPSIDASAPKAFDDVASVLFADSAHMSPNAAACPENLAPDARIRCLFDERYRSDKQAANIAHDLYVKWNIVAGVERAHTMDGGYRGLIRLEPALPVQTERRQLEWIASAFRDVAEVLDGIERRRTEEHPATYRWRPLTLRFVRSVGARTPSAYAHDWTVAWNLAGSLHTSAEAVRDTLVHEIFHLNDYAHPPSGGDAWSLVALEPVYAGVVRRCGTSIRCLAPYSPNDTIVRGGTYYSFQPGNGVREYAAELAVRYFREQRAELRRAAKVPPFKCGSSENARAWALMRDEFWAGVDLVPPCDGPP